MYQSSKVAFTHSLKSLSAMLKAASKHAKAKGIDPNVLANARLAPDMFPLLSQVKIATDHAKGCCARLAGVEAPVFDDKETTLEELQARIKRVLVFIGGLKAAQFEGSETRDIEVKTPVGTFSFNGLDYINGWVLPNYFFHATTTYNILRHNGVELGKKDFLGMIPGMTASGKLAKMLGAKATKKAKPAAKKAKPAAKKAPPAAKKAKPAAKKAKKKA
jgi:hypothetical protein